MAAVEALLATSVTKDAKRAIIKHNAVAGIFSKDVNCAPSQVSRPDS